MVTVMVVSIAAAQDAADFRVPPYLQNPRADGMTIVWFSEGPEPGQLTFADSTGAERTLESTPILAETLTYLRQENGLFDNNQPPPPPYKHRIELDGLAPGTAYEYHVAQGTSRFSSTFVTAPDRESSVRFVVFGDSETEPESTGATVSWEDPSSVVSRQYLIDQTQGYANNIDVITDRQPDLVVIAGDLVEAGGEQRDWDEFWLHATNDDRHESLAGHVPFIAAPGNHEYYAGIGGGYNQTASEGAINRFRTYFEYPPNHSPNAEQENRYFRLDYGPVTLIGLDVANDSPNESDRDSNFFLLGENDAGGGHAPAFGPGSRQYAWLEEQLEQAQRRSRFTFVFFHHAPYSVGPHGYAPGLGSRPPFDRQSGVPVRSLTPLFIRFGVDAVFSGHDEMFERSEIEGLEILPEGSERRHVVQFYDVGVGGDGLRGPAAQLENPFQRFLAHTDAPEVWEGDVLIDGGKHYGHLEVNVQDRGDGSWEAVLEPVYVFPFVSSDGVFEGFERRVYDDVVRLRAGPLRTVVAENDLSSPQQFSLEQNSPNPFNGGTNITYHLATAQQIDLSIYNLTGQRVATIHEGLQMAGTHVAQWTAKDDADRSLSSGMYLYRLTTAEGATDTRRMLLIK